jgi:hypothetical protein
VLASTWIAGHGKWGQGREMSATREVVRENARVARNLIKSHPLTPELSGTLFAQKEINVFRFSAAPFEWSQSSAEDLGTSNQKCMAHTMVKCKLSKQIRNRRGLS